MLNESMTKDHAAALAAFFASMEAVDAAEARIIDFVLYRSTWVPDSLVADLRRATAAAAKANDALRRFEGCAE